MSYKLLLSGSVLRIEDGATIPPTADNLDWVAFQGWLVGGGKPLPADPAPLPLKSLSDGALAAVLVKAGTITQAQVDAGIASEATVLGLN